MKKILAAIIAVIFFGITAQSSLAGDGIDAGALFKKRCKICHAMDKKKAGPAVKRMNADPAKLKAALTTDKVKMMQSVIKKLTADEVGALVVFIQSKHESGGALVAGNGTATEQSVAPLCQGCHGSKGEGLEAASGMPAFPRLAGQIRAYLVQTLNDYKNGTRSNPMMGAIAKGLSEDDISRVASYYAELD